MFHHGSRRTLDVKIVEVDLSSGLEILKHVHG